MSIIVAPSGLKVNKRTRINRRKSLRQLLLKAKHSVAYIPWDQTIRERVKAYKMYCANCGRPRPYKAMSRCKFAHKKRNAWDKVVVKREVFICSHCLDKWNCHFPRFGGDVYSYCDCTERMAFRNYILSTGVHVSFT